MRATMSAAMNARSEAVRSIFLPQRPGKSAQCCAGPDRIAEPPSRSSRSAMRTVESPEMRPDSAKPRLRTRHWTGSEHRVKSAGASPAAVFPNPYAKDRAKDRAKERNAVGKEASAEAALPCSTPHPFAAAPKRREPSPEPGWGPDWGPEPELVEEEPVSLSEADRIRIPAPRAAAIASIGPIGEIAAVARSSRTGSESPGMESEREPAACSAPEKPAQAEKACVRIRYPAPNTA